MNTVYEQRTTRASRQRAITKENYQRFFLRDRPGREPGVNDNFFNLLEMATEDASFIDGSPSHFIYSHATTRSEAVDCIHVYDKPIDDIDNVIGKLKCYNYFQPSVGYVLTEDPSRCESSDPPVDVDEDGEIRLINGSLVRVVKEGLGEKAQFDKILVFVGGGDLNGQEVYVKRKFIQRLAYTDRSLPIVWGTCSPDMGTEVESLLCNATEQDWYTLSKPTYYQNRCEYWVNVPSRYRYSEFNITDNNNLRTREVYQRGIRELLEFYNKNRSEQFLSDIIFNCYMFGEVRSLYPTTTGTNALIVVPARYFHAIPSDTDSVSEFLQKFTGQVASQITFRTNDITSKISEVSDAMLEYNSDKSWRSDEGYVMGPAFYGVFSFNKEVSRLKEVVPALVRMFRANGIVFRRNNPDKVTIGLSRENEILYVLLEQDRFVIPMVIGAKYYSNAEPFKHKRTVNLLSKLDNIIFDINYTQSIPYKTFIEKYIDPIPELDFQKRPGTRKCRGSDSSPFNLNKFFCCLERNFRTSLPNPFGDFMTDQIKGFFDGYKEYELNILSAQSCGNNPYDLVTSSIESTHRLIVNQFPALNNKYTEKDVFGLGIIFEGGALNNEINSTFFGKRFSPIKSQITSLEEDLTLNDLAPFVNECMTYQTQEVVDPYIKELVLSFGKTVRNSIEGDEEFDYDWEKVSEAFSRIDLSYFLKKAMTCACSILEREASPAMYDPRLDAFSTVGGYAGGNEEQNAIRRYFNEFNLRQGPYGSENNLIGIDPTGTTDLDLSGPNDGSDASFGLGQNIDDSRLVTDNRTILPTDWNIAKAVEGALDMFGVDTPSEAAVAHQLVCKDLCKSLPVLCSCIDLSIPKLSGVVDIIDFASNFSITGIFGYLVDLLVETLINVVLDILFGYLRRIIEDLLNCELESTDPEAQNSFNSLMGRATGGMEGKTAEEYGIPIGDRDLLKPYIDDVPLVISPTEMCSLLRGNAARATLNTLEDLMLSQHLALRAYLPDKDAIQELFSILGSNVNVDAICVNLGMITDSTYTRSVENICDTLGISELRRNLERGNTSPEVIADLLEEARNCRANRILALSELTRGISEDPQNFLKRIIPQMLAAPGKDGLIPRDPPELIRLIENAIDGIFNSFAFSFDKEVNSFVDSLIVKSDGSGVILGEEGVPDFGQLTESLEQPPVIMGNLEQDLTEEDNFRRSETEKLGYSVTFDLDMKPFDVEVIDTSKVGNIATLLQGSSLSKIKIDPKIEYSLPLSFQCVGEDRQRDFYEVKISERIQDRNLAVSNETFVLSGEDYLPECAKLELENYEIKGDYSLQQELFSNSLMRQWKANFDLSEDQQEFLRNYFASESFVDITEEAIQALAKTLSESKLLKEEELSNLSLSGDLSCFPPKDSLINVSTIKEEIKDNYYGDTSVDDHRERFNLAMVDGAVKSLIKATIFEFLISGIIPLSRFKMEDIMSDIFVKMSTKVLLDYLDSRGASPLADKTMSPAAFAEFRELLEKAGVSGQKYIDGLQEWSDSFKGEFLRWAKSSVLREIENKEKLYDPFTKERIFVDFEKFYKNQSVIGRRDEERLLITDYYFALRDWYDSYFVFQANLDARGEGERELYDTIGSRVATGLSIANNGLLEFEIENFSNLVWFEGAEEEGLFDIASLEGVRRFEQLRYDIFFLLEDMLKSLLPDDPDNQSRDNISALTLMSVSSGSAGPLGISGPLFMINSYSDNEVKFFDLIRDIENRTDNTFSLRNGILYNGVDLSGTTQEDNRERARRILSFFEEVAYEYKCECIPISNDTIEGVGNNRETFKVIGYLEYLVKQQMDSMRFDIESMLGSEIQNLEELFFGISDPTYVVDSTLGRFDSEERRDFSEDVIDIPFYKIGQLENNPFTTDEISSFNSSFLNSVDKIKNKQRLPIVLERYFVIEEKDPLFWYNFGLKRFGDDGYDRDILGELSDTTAEETEYLYSYFAPQNRTFATRYNFRSDEKNYVASFRVFTEWLAKLRELQEPGNERLLSYVFDPPSGDSDELFCEKDREDKFFFKFKNFFENISIGIRLKYFDTKNNIQQAAILTQRDVKEDVFDKTKSFEYIDPPQGFNPANVYSVVLASREEKLNYNDFIVRPGTLSLQEMIEYRGESINIGTGYVNTRQITGNSVWDFDSFSGYDKFYDINPIDFGQEDVVLSISKTSRLNDIRSFIAQVSNGPGFNYGAKSYFDLLVENRLEIESNSLDPVVDSVLSSYEAGFYNLISSFSDVRWSQGSIRQNRKNIIDFLSINGNNPNDYYEFITFSSTIRSITRDNNTSNFNEDAFLFNIEQYTELSNIDEGRYIHQFIVPPYHSRDESNRQYELGQNRYHRHFDLNPDMHSLTFYDFRAVDPAEWGNQEQVSNTNAYIFEQVLYDQNPWGQLEPQGGFLYNFHRPESRGGYRDSNTLRLIPELGRLSNADIYQNIQQFVLRDNTEDTRKLHKLTDKIPLNALRRAIGGSEIGSRILNHIDLCYDRDLQIRQPYDLWRFFGKIDIDVQFYFFSEFSEVRRGDVLDTYLNYGLYPDQLLVRQSDGNTRQLAGNLLTIDQVNSDEYKRKFYNSIKIKFYWRWTPNQVFSNLVYDLSNFQDNVFDDIDFVRQITTRGPVIDRKVYSRTLQITINGDAELVESENIEDTNKRHLGTGDIAIGGPFQGNLDSRRYCNVDILEQDEPLYELSSKLVHNQKILNFLVELDRLCNEYIVPEIGEIYDGMDNDFKLNYYDYLLNGLKKQCDYKFLSEYAFPIKRLNSLVALYSMQKVYGITREKQLFAETKYNSELILYLTLLSNQDDWWSLNAADAVMSGNLGKIPDWFKFLSELPRYDFSLQAFISFIPRRLMQILFGIPWFSYLLEGLCRVISILPTFTGPSKSCEQLLGNTFSETIQEPAPEKADADCGTPAQVEERRRKAKEKAEGRLNTSGLGDTESPYAE